MALALGVRGVRRDLPLWVLVSVAQGPDWVELLLRLVATGEQAAAWSHAYPWVVMTAAAVAAYVGAWNRSFGASVTVLVLYLSHPVGDYVTGYKVLWSGGPLVGLILADQPGANFAFQASLCVMGWALYRRSLSPASRRGALAVVPLLLLLSLQGLADLVLRSGNERVTRAFMRVSGATDYRPGLRM